MNNRIKSFGKINDGTEVSLYRIGTEDNIWAEISDYGATLVSLWVPDKNGEYDDIVLGYDTPLFYEENSGCLGATIGRNCNRIKDAKFTLDGKEYKLEKNNNGNNIHSGLDFYHKRMWKVTDFEDNKITLTCISKDMDQGYPGNIVVNVTYEVMSDKKISITYEGTSDQTTLFNMTNHSYFNLAGHNSGLIMEQKLWLDSDAFTIADEKSIPTGEIVCVEGTPMDFNTMKPLGQDIDADYEPLKFGSGYDHNWVLKTQGEFKEFARLEDEKSGRKMTVATDLPGVQIYTGNSIKENIQGKQGAIYGPRQGICLETQYYPDSVHHENFPQPILKAGETRKSMTVFQFGVM